MKAKEDTRRGTGLVICHGFFTEAVRPAILLRCPDVLRLAAWGRLGLGSECLGLDDVVSHDHHWGPRVDVLVADDVLDQVLPMLLGPILDALPSSYGGVDLAPCRAAGTLLVPRGIGAFLCQTIGRPIPPERASEWLDIPEEDAFHVVAGEVWEDEPAVVTGIRETFGAYYPDAVWFRRLAHWCRMASGAGVYALQRAVLRGNWCYAYSAFGRAMKLTMELVFLLNRRYFPYDKWLYPLFQRLPVLAPEMVPLFEQATARDAEWNLRIALIEQAHAMIDDYLVREGIIPEHPTFTRSSSAGYRLLEWCYRDLIRRVPEELRRHAPLTQQRFEEGTLGGIVAGFGDAFMRETFNLGFDNADHGVDVLQ